MKALFFLFGFLTMRVVLDVLFVAALVLAFVLWTVGHLQLLTAEWVGPCILGPEGRPGGQPVTRMRELSHAGRHQAVHQDLIPAIRGRKPAVA